MKNLIKKYILVILGLIIGSLSGYIYWKTIGCENGCPITSSPLNSSIWGGLMGGLIFSSFKKSKKNGNKE